MTQVIASPPSERVATSALHAAAAYGTRWRLLVIGLCLVPATILFETIGLWADPKTFGQFPLGHDFVAFWSAAQLFAEGGAGALYDVKAFSALQFEVSGREGVLLWHYPPHYLLMLLPMVGLGFVSAFFVFTAINLAALIAVGRRLLPFSGMAGWVALLGAPVIAASVVQGQNGAFFAACLIGGFWAREARRPWVSAILFALILAKPQYGVLIPVVLLAQGDWRSIVRIAVCCVVFSVSATLALGADIWAYFFSNLEMLRVALSDPALLVQMPTVWAALSLAGLSSEISAVSHAIVATLALAVTWWMARRAEPDMLLAAVLFATLLISPYGFRYDMVMTLGGTLLLMLQARRRQNWPPLAKITLIAMWLLPGLFPAIAIYSGVQLGVLVSLAGLVLCGVWAGVDRRQPHAETA